jgi:hypothetical protein
MPETIPQSRLPRTGVILLLGVVLLIGGGTLLVWMPYHRNQTVMAEVERVGGITETTIVRPLWVPHAVDDGYLTVFERVEGVNLSDAQFRDVGLKYLYGLSNVTHLRLTDSNITDAELEHFSGLTNLGWLYVNNTQIVDAGR